MKILKHSLKVYEIIYSNNATFDRVNFLLSNRFINKFKRISTMVSIPHVLSGISIVLLVIYGIDVLVGGGGAGEGFLPFDAMTRGIGFGFPPIILSFVAFFISKNPPFKGLGIMLIITGILIIIGGLISISSSGESENTARMAGEGGSLIAIGAIIIGLGVIKIKKSQTKVV
jgi:hypothetical protein